MKGFQLDRYVNTDRTPYFPLIITMETTGTIFSPQWDMIVNELCHNLHLVCFIPFFFQVLTTWRLYFLAPKVPAKVLLFSPLCG